jgi:exodeoxyribonuclease VII small subunit
MAKAPDPTPQTFEAALAELETIVATMEDGRLPLAEALAAYKRGAELLQYCQAALKDAQQQVQILERGVLTAFAPGEPDAGTNVSDRSDTGEGDAP